MPVFFSTVYKNMRFAERKCNGSKSNKRLNSTKQVLSTNQRKHHLSLTYLFLKLYLTHAVRGGNVHVRYYLCHAQAVKVFKRPCLDVHLLSRFHLHMYSAEKKNLFLLFDIGKFRNIGIKLTTKLKQLMTINCKFGHKI